MPDIRLDRTFWPVGHGAFYTERFYNYEDGSTFTAVYDCGGKGNLRKGVNASLSSPFMQEKVRDFFQRTFGKERPVIDVLFISHLHRDHINGIPSLLPYVRRIILPQLEETSYIESFVYNAITSDTKTMDVDSELQSFVIALASGSNVSEARLTRVRPSNGERRNNRENKQKDIDSLGDHIESGTQICIPVLVANGIPFWVYIPVNIPIKMDKKETLLDVLGQKLSKNLKGEDGRVNWEALQEALRHADIKEIKKVYETYFEIKDDNHNFYSMPVFSGPIIGQPYYWHLYDFDCFEREILPYYWHREILYHHRPFRRRIMSCLYMGDFEASKDDNLYQLEKDLDKYYYRIGLQQVPHHYSQYNHNIDLYEDKIIAFGNIDDHKDVSFCYHVYKEICTETYLPALLITEEEAPICIRYYMYAKS